MRWYLTTPEREFSEWMPLAIGRDIPNVSLPTNEPEAAVHGDGWSILPLNDTPPTVPADRYIFSRYVRVDPESALVIYTTREKTQEMIDADITNARNSMVVSSAQAQVALYDAGLIDIVETAIEGYPYPKVRIWFRAAQEWKRDHPYIAGLAMEIGLSDEDIDNLFTIAAQVEL